MTTKTKPQNPVGELVRAAALELAHRRKGTLTAERELDTGDLLKLDLGELKQAYAEDPGDEALGYLVGRTEIAQREAAIAPEREAEIQARKKQHEEFLTEYRRKNPPQACPSCGHIPGGV